MLTTRTRSDDNHGFNHVLISSGLVSMYVICSFFNDCLLVVQNDCTTLIYTVSQKKMVLFNSGSNYAKSKMISKMFSLLEKA